MPLVRQTRLAFQEGTSDKVYEVDLHEEPSGFVVTVRYGRRGQALREIPKTNLPVDRDEAEALFDKLVTAKTKKGYVETPANSSTSRRPVDAEARAAAIVARIDAALANPDAETDWPVERVVWRAGELRLTATLPTITALLDRLAASLMETWPRSKKDDRLLRAYCALWALARTGRAVEDRTAPELHAARKAILRLLDAQGPSRWERLRAEHVHDLAQEALHHLANDEERAANRRMQQTGFADVIERLADPDARRAQLDTWLGAIAPSDLYDLRDAIGLALYDVPGAHETLLAFATEAPLAAPFVYWHRRLFKLAELRDAAELYGRLAYRFATEPSGLSAFDTGYEWNHDDGKYRTVGRHLTKNEETGYVEYRQTTSEYDRSSWRDRTIRSETQIRTPDGPEWIDTDDLTPNRVFEEAALGYSEKTRAYLRRRAWRTLRKLGEADDPAYVKMAVGLLLAYTDADADEPREVVFQWYDWQNRAMRARTTRYDAFAPYIAFNHVLYANSPRFELKKGNKAWSLRDGVETGTPAETREEAFSHLWDAQPEGLLHLVAESRCAPVHAFAVRALRANPDFLDRLGVDEVLLLLGRPYADTVRLGLDLAQRLYDPADPNVALVRALLDATLPEARALALGWLADAPDALLTDSAFVADLLAHRYDDVRSAVRDLLARKRPAGLDDEALLIRCMALLLTYEVDSDAANIDAARLRDLGEAMVTLLAGAVRRLALGLIEDLVRHPFPAVQAVGGRLLAHHGTPPEALPGALIAALMTADDAEVRATGLALFGRLPDDVLLDQPEVLDALAQSPQADVRANVRPVILRLAANHPDFAVAMTKRLLPPLYRTERVGGLHADLAALLTDDAFSEARAAFDRDRLWGLLHARPVPAQELGALVLVERDWSGTFTIRQITRLASHEVVAVRDAACAMVERQTDRMRAHPIDALTLLDAAWDDARAFAFDFFARAFDEDVWTPKLLVHVVDSVRSDVQAYGQTLLTRFFDEGDGPTYLLRLSEHPAANVQCFASNYLDAHAGGHLDRMQALEPYFRAVLGQVNRGRVAKDRVLAFLTREAARTPEAAAFAAPLLAHHSATIAVGDKATLIAAMRDLQDAQPDVDLALLERVPVPVHPASNEAASSEVTDAV
ncbi:MAG: WGR domain-containing protein [Bacteroidota bacterium]